MKLFTHRFQPGHLRDRGPKLLGVEGRKRTDAVAAGECRGFFEVTKPPASSRKVATKSPALAAEVSQSRFPVAAWRSRKAWPIASVSPRYGPPRSFSP